MGNVWCSVAKDSPPDLVDWLHETLAVELCEIVDGEPTFWKRYMFSLRTWKFPGGMLSYAQDLAKKDGIQIHLEDGTDDLGTTISKLDKRFDYLNPHQLEAVEEMKRNRVGIIKHPTASGKTDTAVAFASCLDCNVLFVADEKSLIRQAKKRWETRTGEQAGIIGDGKYQLARFTVASFGTLYHHRKSAELQAYLATVGCLFIDECHVLGAKTYWQAAMAVPAYRRYGMSATPFNRSDGMDPYVCAATGPIIHEMQRQELYGVRIVPSHVIFYDYPDSSFRGNWSEVLVKYDQRQKAILRLCLIAPKPCLVFFEWKDHGEYLCNKATELGLNAKIVHGKYGTDYRVDVLASLNEGNIDVLFASKIFMKGIDAPNLRSCINAAGMKAVIPAIQRLGRGDRITEDKSILYFFDLVDGINSTNKSHSTKRKQTYLGEGVQVDTCSSISEIVEILGSDIDKPDRKLPTMTVAEIEGKRFKEDNEVVVPCIETNVATKLNKNPQSLSSIISERRVLPNRISRCTKGSRFPPSHSHCCILKSKKN